MGVDPRSLAGAPAETWGCVIWTEWALAGMGAEYAAEKKILKKKGLIK